MDKIFLHGMRAETLIGVYGWEREHLQPLIIDLDIGVPEKAAADDDIGNTVHYAEVCETLRRQLKEQDFLLLEALAEYIADWVLGCFGAVWVHVKIVKPGILPGVREVGVEIERDKDKD